MTQALQKTATGGRYLLREQSLQGTARQQDQLTEAQARALDVRRQGLLLDNGFHKLLELALRPENKLALLDYPTRRIVLINQSHGAELDGLWLSSTRWIDRKLLPLVTPPQPQERNYEPTEVRFL